MEGSDRRLLVVRMDEIEERSGGQIVELVAEGRLPRGVELMEPSVEAGHDEQVRREGEEAIELVLRGLLARALLTKVRDLERRPPPSDGSSHLDRGVSDEHSQKSLAHCRIRL